MRLYIKTFGCQMNVRDSEFVMGHLLESGFRAAKSVDDADIMIFNSCSVREHAENRLFSNIGDMAKLKKKKPGIIVGLMGCTAQSYKARALKRSPVLDFVCGPGDETRIPEMIKDIIKHRCPMVAAEGVDSKRPEIFPSYRESPFKALVSIGEGCNNYCSYCIVPYVRGRERYRDAKDIIREVKDLARRGFKEITLLGQNVNSYGEIAKSQGHKVTKFVELLEQLNSIKGIERIRFMTSHPKDASEGLFKAMASLDKVCRHLHLPLQSGSNRILKLMNRGYTIEKYLKLASLYKKIVPDGALTSDIVVGFPSETKRDFQDTLDIVERIGFDSTYVFKYSPRPPAKSVKLKDNVSQDEKEARLKKLLDVQKDISLKRNLPLEGMVLEVLVDGVSKKSYSILTGRTRTNKVVVFDGNKNLVGKIVNVKIKEAAPYVLKGRMVK